jgi:predicted neuraminidase
MPLRKCAFRLGLTLCLLALVSAPLDGAEPLYQAELIFPLNAQHNHAPGIAELPGGELVVSWYRGSGERSADDVAVWGSRLKRGEAQWSEPQVWADTPGFPDCNTCLHVDRRGRLWLFWPVIIANSWESALTHYRVSKTPTGDGAPDWSKHGIILLKPEDFREAAIEKIDAALAQDGPVSDRLQAEIAEAKGRLGDKLFQRLGWQPRCKPTVLPSGRILLPLYTDTFSMSIMAISDDDGKTWTASKPLIGLGNIQPSVLRRNDGTLVAYMRENGARDRIRVCESSDDGETWGPVESSELPNPGSGLDAVRLDSGHWLLVYNDTVKGRNSLAASLSKDEGKTWAVTRHLEQEAAGSYHYPAVIQAADGTIHCVYSYFVDGGKSMKHAAFNEAWVESTEK